MGGRLGGRRGHSAAIAFVGGLALSSHGSRLKKPQLFWVQLREAAAPLAKPQPGRAEPARSGNPDAAKADIAKLAELREKLRTAKDAYWAEQVDIQWQVATAWDLNAEGKYEDAPKRYERRCRCRGQD
jgi:hypothetical protein